MRSYQKCIFWNLLKTVQLRNQIETLQSIDLIIEQINSYDF